MPPSTVQTVFTTYAAGQNPTQAITLTAGNIICGEITWNSATVMTSISSALGNTYSIVDQNNSQGGKSSATFWGVAGTGGSETITFNHGASATSHWIVHEVSGIDTATGLDQHVMDVINTATTGANSILGSNVTPTTDGQYCASFFIAEINGVAVSQGTEIAWVLERSASSGNVCSESFVQGTAGAIRSAWSKTGGGTSNVGVGLMTFKATPTGPGSGSDSSMVGVSEASTSLITVGVIEETS